MSITRHIFNSTNFCLLKKLSILKRSESRNHTLKWTRRNFTSYQKHLPIQYFKGMMDLYHLRCHYYQQSRVVWGIGVPAYWPGYFPSQTRIFYFSYSDKFGSNNRAFTLFHYFVNKIIFITEITAFNQLLKKVEIQAHFWEKKLNKECPRILTFSVTKIYFCLNSFYDRINSILNSINWNNQQLTRPKH